MDFRFSLSICLMTLVFLLTMPFSAMAAQELSGQDLINALRQGGYNLYFRHEATDWSQQDRIRDPGDFDSCDGKRVRQLSDRGRQRAQRTGEAMRSLNIPVSEVVASPYCRAMETAQLLGLGEVTATTEVINMRVAEYFGGREGVIATARELLARPPAAGGNRVIVAHGNVARAATPVYPGEGESAIFEPDGRGNFSFVGRIAHELWIQLSQ